MLSTAGVLGGFIGCIFFRATLLTPARLSLALAEDFVRLATVRFDVFARLGLQTLPAFRTAADLPRRTVAVSANLEDGKPVSSSSEPHPSVCVKTLGPSPRTTFSSTLRAGVA
jgi:hypothetical protein